MNDSNCKVSIITVVYNGVTTIEQTIKSVLGQTYKNIEYIMIDGASTDGTQHIIEKYAGDISYYVSEKDEGLYYAMNKGIEKATGEIIGIINSDDWYDINAVKNMVDCFNKSEAELVYGQTIIVEEDGREKASKIGRLQTLWYKAPFRHPSVFVKKSVYRRLGGFNVNYVVASDYDLLLRFYSQNVKFVYLDKVIAYFRLGGLSTTQRKLSYKENYNISMKYVERCSYKDKVIPKIKEIYNWACFSEEISKPNEKLYKLICEYFNAAVNDLIIFGTGIWGKRCYTALSQAGITSINFSDNNPMMWNTEFQGIKVIKPSELKNIDAYVLIAVKEQGDEIKKQLIHIGNKELKFVSIGEIKNLLKDKGEIQNKGAIVR